MNTYRFELRFKLRSGENAEDHLDALFEAGCDDSTVSTGKLGFILLSFSREAENATEAIKSALCSVKKAIPHATIESASPYLMNLSDLAQEFGFTKQNMSKYARGESKLDEMPLPAVASRTSFWHVAKVALWLDDGGVIEMTEEQYDLYLTIWALSSAIEKARNPKTNDEFFELVKMA